MVVIPTINYQTKEMSYMKTSKENSAYKSYQIEFDRCHNNPTDCQLLVAITGKREAIIQALKKLIDECESSYRKPYQGTTLCYEHNISVATPIWEGKPY
jgi:hypothetical protein